MKIVGSKEKGYVKTSSFERKDDKKVKPEEADTNKKTDK